MPIRPSSSTRTSACTSTGCAWASWRSSCVCAVAANIALNLRFQNLAGVFPLIGAGVWLAIVVSIPLRRPDWEVLPETFKGTLFLLSLVTAASMMPVETLPASVVAGGARPRLRLRGLRQHSADGAGAQAGRLRLGVSRLRGRLRRVDDLVRLVGGRCAVEPVSGSEVGGRVASPWLVHPRRLRRRLSSCSWPCWDGIPICVDRRP